MVIIHKKSNDLMYPPKPNDACGECGLYSTKCSNGDGLVAIWEQEERVAKNKTDKNLMQKIKGTTKKRMGCLCCTCFHFRRRLFRAARSSFVRRMSAASRMDFRALEVVLERRERVRRKKRARLVESDERGLGIVLLVDDDDDDVVG
mmetsp:Transcript_23170/g.30688  ORF Transcript_23170/g.30688 Transcript_23170/m.30688 type:complete len:147 (-) Transcript_23170:955-1395(-)